MMTREQYHENLAKKASVVLKTLREKELGYNPTIGTDEYDPFYNYEKSSEIAGITKEQSLIARTVEKLLRIVNVLENPERAGLESLPNSCADAVGHMLILWESVESLNEELDVTPLATQEELPLVSPELTQRSPILNSLLNWTKK